MLAGYFGEITMRTKEELQKSIYTDTVRMQKLAGTAIKLPDGNTKQDFLDQAGDLVDKIAIDIDELNQVAPASCQFGFTTNQCPGCACAYCQYRPVDCPIKF